MDKKVNLTVSSLRLGSSADSILSLQADALDSFWTVAQRASRLKGAREIGLLTEQGKLQGTKSPLNSCGPRLLLTALQYRV